MIEGIQLHKYFGNLHVLKGVTLQVDAGEIVSVAGERGGKKNDVVAGIGNPRKSRWG
jgi:ABC-type histidine transport system ATPase subunit